MTIIMVILLQLFKIGYLHLLFYSDMITYGFYSHFETLQSFQIQVPKDIQYPMKIFCFLK